MSRQRAEERCYEGLGVSAGIAIGPAFVAEGRSWNVPEYAIEPGDVAAEQARFDAAVARAVHQLDKLKAKSTGLPAGAAEDVGLILEAHLAILDDSRLIRGVRGRIETHAINAEAAVHQEVRAISRQFAQIDDAYLAARAADIEEAGGRLIRNLTNHKYRAFSGLPRGTVILAEDITPADAAMMDPGRIAGFSTVLGGAEGHTAIMARSLGLPAVLGVSGLTGAVEHGAIVIVDGGHGRIIVDPGPETLAEYEQRQVQRRAEQARLSALVTLPSRTRDGTDVSLQVNLELPWEVAAAREVQADGVGLLRTEYLFMNREDLPGEDEQAETLGDIVEAMAGRPVTMRTLDIGGEKLASAVAMPPSPVSNPAMGLRGLRLSLRQRDLFETQLAAMLRAAGRGPARILLPLVNHPDQMREARQIYEAASRRLAAAGVGLPDPLPPLGAMIEVPAAALCAEALAEVSDFFAIGTNDLAMYTLAIDRADDQLAALFDPADPAVLRLIDMTVRAAGSAGIPVSLCGEIAGDPDLTETLLELGVTDLSMSPGRLLAVKERVRMVRLAPGRRRG